MLALTPAARSVTLQFLLFSLASAFLLLTGLALARAVTGTTDLSAFLAAGPVAAPAFVLIALGCLVKIGVIGVHVWLPAAYAKADDDFSAMLSAVVGKVAVFGLFMAAYQAARSDAGLELARALGWIGMLTTVIAAFLALQQAEMKRMLAYSSLSQTGYIITAVALMSHLGWVTALYLVANHLMVKGILFLVAAAVIERTGLTRLEACGGLARRMPLTFAVAIVALVSMSGLPPLAGFGGKWLLLSAMVDRGWYGPLALGVLATLVGLLYMVRFGHAVFLGPLKLEHATLREAPAALLVPQCVLVAGILLLSFFPKLLMDPVSAAIDPQFASTLVWQGMSLELIYAYWNPARAMAGAVGLALLGAALMWIFYRIGRRSSRSGGPARFFRYYRPLLAPVLASHAERFWGAVSATVGGAAGTARRVYTGNGQTYALQVLAYVLVLYLFVVAFPLIGGG